MRIVSIIAIAVSVVIATSGCAPVLKAPIGDEGVEKASDQLDHGYALLYQLLKDESRVADILKIKNPYDETAEILVSISETANKGIKLIEKGVTDKPVLVLEKSGLPMIETDARNRIANSVTMALVLALGTSFEVQILLSQEKACGYAAALCESLANADPNRDRAEGIGKLGKSFSELGGKVRGRLTIIVPAKDTTSGS